MFVDKDMNTVYISFFTGGENAIISEILIYDKWKDIRNNICPQFAVVLERIQCLQGNF